MLISHRYKFIYLKTEKTASSSLFEMFRQIASEHDTLHPADWRVARQLLQQHGTLDGHSFVGGAGYLARRVSARRGIHRHGKIADVRKLLGSDLFASYTIVTSERNPWDRQVSLFTHRRTKHPAGNIRDFKAAMVSRSYNLFHLNKLDNWGIYSIDDQPVADHVIRYENLAEDYVNTLRALKIDPEQWPLPHLRAKERFEGKDYRNYYSDEVRDLIGGWYKNEIRHFGYQF